MALFVIGCDQVIDLKSICEAHWENERLLVRFTGGGYVWLIGDAAGQLWLKLSGRPVSSGVTEEAAAAGV